MMHMITCKKCHATFTSENGRCPTCVAKGDIFNDAISYVMGGYVTGINIFNLIMLRDENAVLEFIVRFKEEIGLKLKKLVDLS